LELSSTISVLTTWAHAAQLNEALPTKIKSEIIMKRTLLALPCLILAGAFATPSSAMPVGKPAVSESAVQEVGYRKCSWRHGHRHCRYVNDGPSVTIQLGRDRHRHHRRYGKRHYNNYGHHHHRRGGAEIRIR
jgi:hypothetical protein